MSSLLRLDANFFHLINGLSHRWFVLDLLSIFFASYALPVLFLIGFFFVCRKARTLPEGTFLVARLFVATTLPYLVSFCLRLAINRPRPFLVFSDVKPLVSVAGDFFVPSFPSGHATLAFAFAAACFLFLGKRSGYVCGFLAFFIALARVFTGVHFVSDIVAGGAIGILGAWAAKSIFWHPMGSNVPFRSLRKKKGGV